ncbi:MAG TPA: DUF5681 domain-containing protein [Xanthobacteraceae bacterium]|nr:DUF5681 domain-containing protein [Xanthobacteraceae bacterium]
MTFQPGQSGNPAGRAVGSRNKKTLAVEAALFERAQELVDDLVERAKRGEPAAMRLAMERILPVGRGRPLPIELPAVRSTEDALAAADVIMAALKEGAISAREAVDLLRVVEGLTRLTGAIDFIKKVARREVAKAAQTLGFDHFFAGPPAANDYARRLAEMNGDGEAAADETDEADDDENQYRSSQDPLYRCGDERSPGAAHPGSDCLQIVADSPAEARAAEGG